MKEAALLALKDISVGSKTSMNQKKCLIVTTHYRPLIGGALTVYDALASHAQGAVSVLTASTDYTTGAEALGWQRFDADCGYKITRVTEMRQGYLPDGTSIWGRIKNRMKAANLQKKILAATLRCIEENTIDVVCIGAQDALGWLVKPLKKQTKCKVIIYVHGEEVSQAAHSVNAERARRGVLNSADGLIAVSSFTADLLHQKYGVPKARIALQNNGVDLNKYSGSFADEARQNNNLPEGPFVFACGRLVERKGFDRLLEAWPSVVAAVPGATLVIGGRGPLEAVLKQRIAELNIGDSTQMPGWMREETLAAAYGLADVFTMSNRTMPDGDTEGFGLVFLEAAAMGTPSVGGRAGGAVDAIIDGKTGILVNGNDETEISGALIKLLSDDHMRKTMAKQAQSHARSQGWQSKTEEFLAYLTRL